MKKLSNHNGFTLIELLVTISVSAIMLAAATPSLKEIYYNNKSLAYSNDLRNAFYRAQNEAIKRNRTVKIQARTANNQFWQGGWDIYQDANNDNIVDDSEVIFTYTSSNANYTLKSENAAFGSVVSFNSFGFPESNAGSANGNFWICRPDNSNALSRTVTVAISGYISVSKGATCTTGS